MLTRNLAVFAAVIGLAGCASAPPRPAEFATAREKIDSAEAAFARGDERSAVFLERASQELKHARTALQENDVVEAQTWAKQASADAETARDIALELASGATDLSAGERGDTRRLQSLPPASRSLPSSP